MCEGFDRRSELSRSDVTKLSVIEMAALESAGEPASSFRLESNMSTTSCNLSDSAASFTCSHQQSCSETAQSLLSETTAANVLAKIFMCIITTYGKIIKC